MSLHICKRKHLIKSLFKVLEIGALYLNQKPWIADCSDEFLIPSEVFAFSGEMIIGDCVVILASNATCGQ